MCPVGINTQPSVKLHIMEEANMRLHRTDPRPRSCLSPAEEGLGSVCGSEEDKNLSDAPQLTPAARYCHKTGLIDVYKIDR
jgi:hypothetical protein